MNSEKAIINHLSSLSDSIPKGILPITTATEEMAIRSPTSNLEAPRRVKYRVIMGPMIVFPIKKLKDMIKSRYNLLSAIQTQPLHRFLTLSEAFGSFRVKPIFKEVYDPAILKYKSKAEYF